MILSMQYMRAVAALLVVIHHARFKASIYSTNPLEWFNVGGAGVDLFFIISGFIMCYTVDNKKISVRKFLIARVKRIIPLYWVLTSFALLVFMFYPDKINSSGGVTNIAASYFLFPTTDSYLIKNGWTLSYEFLFYSLFAIGLLLTTKIRFLIPIILIVTLVSAGAFYETNNPILNFMTDQFLLEFVFGIFLFYFFKKVTLNTVVGFTFITLATLGFYMANLNQLNYPRVIEYGLPALLLFIGMLSFEPFFQKNKSHPILMLFENMGNSSYSLYLLHPFVLVATTMVLVKLDLTEHGYLFVALLSISSIIGGHLCYLLLEKNLQKIVRHFSAK